MRCLYVCLSVCVCLTFVNSVKTNKHGIKIFSPSGSHAILVFPCQTAQQYSDGNPLTGASNAGGVGRNHDSEPISGLTACVNAATDQVLSTGSPVDHGHRLASYDTSLVVSGGVDCGRRRRNVYIKKPQRYAKYNRTAHLTARSDKSVVYVTNNNRLLDVLYCWS